MSAADATGVSMKASAGFVASAVTWRPVINAQNKVCKSSSRPRCRRGRPVITCCKQEQFQPVEPGVQLAPLPDLDALDAQCAWLAGAVTQWLDEEWQTAENCYVHERIGFAAARIYGRQRMEGENDLSGVLLAIANEMQAFDMSEAFVGPFNVANKVSELLLHHCSVGRARQEMVASSLNKELSKTIDADNADQSANMQSGPSESRAGSDEDAETESHDQFAGRDITPDLRADEPQGGDEWDAFFPAPGRELPAPEPPVFVDAIDKHLFIRDLLEGELEDSVVAGAVAQTVGYTYDKASRSWDGQEVKDQFFRQFGDQPPKDILTNGTLLRHFEKRLAKGDDSGKRAVGLQVYVEAMHGEEMTRILRESKDRGFRAREITAMFLHFFGEF